MSVNILGESFVRNVVSCLSIGWIMTRILCADISLELKKVGTC